MAKSKSEMAGIKSGNAPIGRARPTGANRELYNRIQDLACEGKDGDWFEWVYPKCPSGGQYSMVNRIIQRLRGLRMSCRAHATKGNTWVFVLSKVQE